MFYPLTPEFAVAGQIGPQDLPSIAAAGFKSVICNRPDHESPGQPDYAVIQEAAQKAGLQARYQPVDSGYITEADARELSALLRELPAPVLAYCRSGTRSGSMYQLARQLEGD